MYECAGAYPVCWRHPATGSYGPGPTLPGGPQSAGAPGQITAVSQAGATGAMETVLCLADQ